MIRDPAGTYVRDTWDWLGADAIFATCGMAITPSTTLGLVLQNVSPIGEFFDAYYLYATIDNAASYRLFVSPTINQSGLLSNPQQNYVNPMEGSPPVTIVGTGGLTGDAKSIHQTALTFNEIFWPKISFGRFVRVPPNWYFGLNVNNGTNSSSLHVTWFGQMVTDTDVHETAAPSARLA